MRLMSKTIKKRLLSRPLEEGANPTLTASKMRTSKTSPKEQTTKSTDAMNRALERFCADYLADKLTPAQRKVVEERISRGDVAIIETLKRLQGDDARIHTPKSASERFEEDMRSLGVEPKEIPNKGIKHDQEHLKQEVAKPKKRSSREAFKLIFTGPKSIFALFIAAIIFGLTVMIIYLQTERTRLHTQVERTQTQMEELQSRTYQERTTYTEATARFDWFKALLRQPNLIQNELDPSNNLLGGSKLWFDPSSLRLAFMPSKDKIPPGMVISLWSEGLAQPQLIGMINPLKKDSLYTQWNTQALLMVNQIDFRVGLLNEGSVDYTQTKRVLRAELRTP